MKSEALSFNFKARYYKSGDITSKTKQVLIVFHGYGQLAKYFIRKFDTVANDTRVVIAPEGLSHFYLEDINKRSQNGNHRVGATWMTRENRLVDIDNYLAYLNAVLLKELDGSDISVIVLGFSQGAATATRWVLQGHFQFDKLILWAGIFPPDMDFEKGHEILKDKPVLHVLGQDDPFVTDERLAEMNQLCEKLSIAPIQIKFDGGHEIDSCTLQKVIDQ